MSETTLPCFSSVSTFIILPSELSSIHGLLGLEALVENEMDFKPDGEISKRSGLFMGNEADGSWTNLFIESSYLLSPLGMNISLITLLESYVQIY